MSLLPYSLARPFLFGLDPEAAHDLTMDSLARLQGTPLSWAWCAGLVDDPIELAGLKFPNRVGLAAGLDKNARCIDGLGAMGFGFVEVGTVTPMPQPGNPKPRMFRLPQANALINRLGFNNDGLDAFVANVQRASFRRQGRILGLNIGKNAATPIESATQDYLLGLEGVYPHADYVTVNISSPNTKNLRALQCDEALDALLGALRCAARGTGARTRPPRAAVRQDRARPGRSAGRGDRRHPAPARHGRRDRHQHHHRARGREGPAACRRSRRPERRAGAGGEQPRDRAAARGPGPGFPDHRRGRHPERRRRGEQDARRRRRGADLHRADLQGPGPGARGGPGAQGSCAGPPNSASSTATSSAMAIALVSPGDSIPNRFTSPGTPCSAGPSIRKSGAFSCGPWILGRTPL